MYEQLSHLLEKFPSLAEVVDDRGKTPLHHMIASMHPDSIDKKCLTLLTKKSSPKIVHHAILSEAPWHEVMEVVKAKPDGLMMEDNNSGLIPFMMVAQDVRYDLNEVYELLSLLPDVLKVYHD